MPDRLLVGTRKGLFTFARKPHTLRPHWEIAATAFLGDPVTMTLTDPRDGTLYAAVGHGHFGVKMHRSRDHGATWQEIASPAYPKPPGGVSPDKCPMRGTTIPWNTELVWSLEAGGADQPGVIWCGTMPGGLFRSADHGDTWEFIRSLWDKPERAQWMGGGMDYPAIHSICVDPRNSAHVTLAISCGGVWHTRDHGKTWALSGRGIRNSYMPPEQAEDPNTQDPHRLVQCPAEPDKLWVQHHNGIFRSTNGGQSWTEIASAGPSVFGFAVAVHPHLGDTAWFVPATVDQKRYPVDGKVSVTRTRNGGKSFDTLRTGLPQEHAYDISFRHGLDIDRNGDRVAFGSTTGSLWLSEDQGDQWLTLSTHLPPVYVVRFV